MTELAFGDVEEAIDMQRATWNSDATDAWTTVYSYGGSLIEPVLYERKSPYLQALGHGSACR